MRVACQFFLCLAVAVVAGLAAVEKCDRSHLVKAESSTESVADGTQLMVCCMRFRDVHRFEFPGYVPPSELKFETLEPVDRKTLHHPSRGTLNEIYATAICGNDLTSSVLYVIGVTTTLAGQLAPLCLISVGLVLYLFKSVYGEVRIIRIEHVRRRWVCAT